MNQRLRALIGNPVLLLVLLLPVVAVVAGVSLVVIATRGGSDRVVDEVQQTRQIQTRDFSADETAQRERLSAIIRIDADSGVIEVLPVTGRFDADAPLRLRLLHPSRAAADLDLTLAPGGNGWRSDAHFDASHDWNLRLSGDDGRWRLQGRWQGGQLAAHLNPALAGDDGP